MTSVAVAVQVCSAFGKQGASQRCWTIERKLVGNVTTKVTRRELLMVTGPLSTLSLILPSSALGEQVRLEDVENQKLQDAIRAAVNEDPTSASVWSNRGNVRISLGKYEDALDDFTKAVTLAPEAPVPLLNRAIANEALGRFEEAIADCEAAIRIDPQEYAAWYNLGNVDVQVKDYVSALSAYEKAASLAPGIAGYRLKEALVLFQLDKSEQAKKLLRGLVRKYPNYAEAHAALAALLWKEGSRSQAEDQLNQASSRDSKFNDIGWVKTSLRWPPVVVDAMENFLTINMN